MSGAVTAILIVLIAVGGLTTGVVTYFRLQRHRADAVAMANYRKLAEEAVARQEAVENRLRELDSRLTEIERMLRSID
ncbi:hypothetical protein SAMN04487904_10378 [Actinopolyspora lacussalsi subsp. righensis]|uniref:Uncharacterized protein n=2 Tax=Actinopolyspora alba group TaxID=2893675 RepID=A0A1I2BK78_9ACTN|nr:MULTISPECIES: hypothetical protein [Actinopolyspora alba group]SFE56198.1 hypothetical protein SAMN04487819_116137 [Actinopolyspora alba]SFT52538.1 hypothetical protein SAMN04487904_10378 [Actinopolyspora righensis]